MKYSLKVLAPLFLLLLLSLMGCSSKKDVVSCPFTEITWESSLEDVQALEGEPTESYPSSYKGITYVYPKQYDGMDGSIKYMFDDQNKLKSMAWVYLPTSAEDLENVYEDLVSRTTKWYGDSGFDSDLVTAKGEVWYLEGGNVLIGVMSTGINEAIQYQYFHPEVSSEKPQNRSNNLKSIFENIFS